MVRWSVLWSTPRSYFCMHPEISTGWDLKSCNAYQWCSKSRGRCLWAVNALMHTARHIVRHAYTWCTHAQAERKRLYVHVSTHVFSWRCSIEKRGERRPPAEMLRILGGADKRICFTDFISSRSWRRWRRKWRWRWACHSRELVHAPQDHLRVWEVRWRIA